MNFKQELREALRREPAPPDFTGKVLARAGKPGRRERGGTGKSAVVSIWRRPVTWAVAAGISIAAAVPSGIVVHQRQEKERAIEARRELMLALSITRAQLQQAREKVQRGTKHRL